jgi:preprotein translocase subunit SecA
MREFEKRIMLQILDHLWKDHLATMDHLRQGIHLRGYAQKNPKQEYKRESFELFKMLLDEIKHETIKYMSHVQFVRDDDVKRMEQQARAEADALDMQFKHDSAPALEQEQQAPAPAPAEQVEKPFVRGGKKVGRNDECPCGSGKKFKQCHGKLA